MRKRKNGLGQMRLLKIKWVVAVRDIGGAGMIVGLKDDVAEMEGGRMMRRRAAGENGLVDVIMAVAEGEAVAGEGEDSWM